MREQCPNCGADLPAGAPACPECGSDEQTGWSEAAQIEGLDLTQDSFNYDEYTKREFGSGSPVPRGIHWFWWLVAVALLAALALFFLRR